MTGERRRQPWACQQDGGGAVAPAVGMAAVHALLAASELLAGLSGVRTAAACSGGGGGGRLASALEPPAQPQNDPYR